MRILYMANSWLGWQILRWLKTEGEDIIGLVIHPPSKQKYVEDILDIADLPSDRVFDSSTLRQEDVIEDVRGLRPDIGLSVLLDVILKPPFFTLFPKGVVNVHPAYLPYNRGQYPNVWSIIEGTPSGVTIHYIDEGIDTGDIIAQEEVPVEPVDTGESLYHKLERAGLELFVDTWPGVRAGKVSRIVQRDEEGTYHRARDVEVVDEIDLGREYQAKDLVNILRARTFPPHKGAYFVSQGKRVYLRIQLEYGDE